MTIEEQIRALEERLLEPEVRASQVELERLISKDFVEFGSSGRTYDASAIIATLTGDPELNGDPSLLDFRVLVLADDIAFATYRLGKSLRSSLWRLEEGTWRILFHQGTPTT